MPTDIFQDVKDSYQAHLKELEPYTTGRCKVCLKEFPVSWYSRNNDIAKLYCSDRHAQLFRESF